MMQVMIRGKHRKVARSTDETVNGDPASEIEERRAGRRRRGGTTWTDEWWEGSSSRTTVDARDENPGGFKPGCLRNGRQRDQAGPTTKRTSKVQKGRPSSQSDRSRLFGT